MTDALSDDVAIAALDSRLKAIVEDVCRITGMGFAAIARVTEQRWIACQVADRIEFGLEPGDELEIKTTICDDIRRDGQLIVIDHVAADPAWRTHHTPALYGFQSYVSVPINLADGSFFGTLCAIDPEPHDVSAREIVDQLRDAAERAAAILSEILSIGRRRGEPARLT